MLTDSKFLTNSIVFAAINMFYLFKNLMYSFVENNTYV